MKNLRKRLFVDRKVQLDLIVRFIVHWFLFVSLSGVVLILWKTSIHPDLDQSLAEHLSSLSTTILVLIATSVTLLPFFVYDALKTTNRFAGPMIRLHRTIRAAANGEKVGPIRFRNDDYWQDVAKDFSILIEYYQQKQAEAASRAKDQESSSAASREPVEAGPG